MAGYREAHKHTWRLRVMPGYRDWDVPASQSPMPGLLLRCACRAFVLVQEIDEESGAMRTTCSTWGGTSHSMPVIWSRWRRSCPCGDGASPSRSGKRRSRPVASRVPRGQ